MRIDFTDCPFGTVVYLPIDGVAEKAVVTVSARTKADGVTARPPTLAYENLRLGQRQLNAYADVEAYSTAEECLPPVEAPPDEATDTPPAPLFGGAA